MRARWCPVLLAAVTGCVQEAATAPGPARPAADDGRVRDGTTGWARIATGAGVELLPYVAYRGHAIYQHDLDLGPISSVDARSNGATQEQHLVAVPWPGGRVALAFHPGFDGTARDTVRAAVAELEDVLPVDFHEVTAGQHDGPWVELAWAPAGADHGALSTAVGMIAADRLHCSPHDGCRTGGGSWIYFPPGAPLGRTAVKHQLLHALGLWHEQSRPDRDAHVAVDTTCIASSLDQFARRSAAIDLGPYDVASIMQGDSRTDCVADPARDGDAYLGGCSCLPMTRRRDADDDGRPDRIAAAADLSVEDVNGLWRRYAGALGAGADGDGLGAAVAIGDFDRDGYDDVAVGAPGDDGVAADAGAVYLFKGTSSVLVPWRLLTQLAVPGEDHGAGDGFGAALAAGDVDGDGTDDLVVGVPGEDRAQLADAGVVHVFRGGRGGPRFGASYGASDGGGDPAGGARFGAALAMGRLTAGDIPELIVGAPGELVAASSGRSVRGGAVYALHDDPAHVMRLAPVRLTAPAPVEGDRFGAALAVGRLDGAHLDLAVGAPGGGRVVVFAGASWSARQVRGRGGDRLGASLLIADVAGDARGELIAGAPGGDGRVVIWRLAGDELVTAQVIPGPRASAFGAALAAYPRIGHGSHHDLLVGAPDRGAGEVTMFRAPEAGVGAGLVAMGTVPRGDGIRGERFGATLAVGRLDGTGELAALDDPFAPSTLDLVVGVPGRRGGAIAVLDGRAAGSLGPGRTYTQESAGAR